MALTTFDGFVASAKQEISMIKTATRTSVAASWTSVFDLAGNPGAGVLAGTSTTTGVVPTDATAGCPNIAAFGGGATGYLSQLDFGATVACRIRVFDLLWKGGGIRLQRQHHRPDADQLFKPCAGRHRLFEHPALV